MQEPFAVNNRKISARQIHRTLTLELLGISTLLLPSRLASACGMDGIFALLAGGAGAFALLIFWQRQFQNRGLRECVDCMTPVARMGIRIFYGAGFTGIAAYTLYLMTALIEQQLLGKDREAVILLSLSGAAFFGLLRGMECRVRVYEVLYWILLIPLFVMLGIACVGISPDAWSILADSDAGSFVQSCYVSFLFFAGASLYICFLPACRKPDAAYRGTRQALVLVIGCNLAVYLILLGVFQRELLAHRQWPVIDLMAVVKLPGNFLERQDALMIGIWFFCLFAFLESMLYYAADFFPEMVHHCSESENGRHRDSNPKKRGWIRIGLFVCITAGMADLMLTQEPVADKIFRGYLYGVLPLMLLLPVPCALIARKNQ